MIQKSKKGIYKITNIQNGKIYIGQTSNFSKRFNEHRLSLNKKIHHSKHLQRAWDKYGEENFKFEILEIVDDTLILDEREQYYLDIFESWNRNKGYNIARDASAPGRGSRHTKKWKLEASKRTSGENNPMYGRERTSEWKRQHSIRMSGKNSPFYGKHHTDKAKKKIRNGNLGRVITDSTKQKMSKNHSDVSGSKNPNFGKHFSPESRKKISDANKGKVPWNKGKKKEKKDAKV